MQLSKSYRADIAHCFRGTLKGPITANGLVCPTLTCTMSESLHSTLQGTFHRGYRIIILAMRLLSSRPPSSPADYPVYQAYCLDAGARLCSEAELGRGLGWNTGCGSSMPHVWTNTHCDLPRRAGRASTRESTT